MSVYKQMEEAGLTLEEIQELLQLLKGALPKIKQRVDSKIRTAILAKNLRANLMKGSGIDIPHDIDDASEDLEKGYNLLVSANGKLSKFEKLFNEC